MGFIWKAAILLFLSGLIIGPLALGLVCAYGVFAFMDTFVFPGG
jgi:hypothetical protein